MAAETLEARLAQLEQRLDARRVKQAPGQMGLFGGQGQGVPCGESHISPTKKCRIGKGSPAKAARKPAAAPPQAAPAADIALEGDEPRYRGLKPTRGLGGGAFGKTFQFDTAGGPVVVKINGLTMGDPHEDNPSIGLAQQRENVARREFSNLQRAHAAGLGPEPLGELQQLPDGRWSMAYRMIPGSPLTPDHRTLELTPETSATMQVAGAPERYIAGALQLARRQADNSLMHGDLHGGNILIAPDGTPTLIDWAMTVKTRSLFDRSPRSAAERATDEIYAFEPMLSYAAMEVPKVMEVAMEQGKLTRPALDRAKEALKAYQAVIDAHDLEWEGANSDKVAEVFEKGQFMRRMKEARRLMREEGISYELAERDPRVGLQPPLTPEVLARAAAAEEAIFGEADLAELRRELDRRYGQPGGAS